MFEGLVEKVVAKKKKLKEKGSVANYLIGGFLSIFIALILITALWPTLTSQVSTVQNDANSTAAVKSLWSIVPLLLVVVVIVGIAVLVIKAVSRKF